MAQSQKLRNCDVLTEQQSQTYIRNLLRAGLSCIFYLRGIFEENHFIDKNLCGINIKALLPIDRDAITLTQWVEAGVFDALQHKYTIIFGVYLDADNEDTMIESYMFHISYPSKNSFDISVEKNGTGRSGHCISAVATPTKEDIKQATTLLIRRLLSLTQTLQPLPKERHMVMKLLYYSDVTPRDYSPPFFSTRFGLSPISEVQAEDYTVGSVNTPYHTLTFTLRSSMDVLQGSPKKALKASPASARSGQEKCVGVAESPREGRKRDTRSSSLDLSVEGSRHAGGDFCSTQDSEDTIDGTQASLNVSVHVPASQLDEDVVFPLRPQRASRVGDKSKDFGLQKPARRASTRRGSSRHGEKVVLDHRCSKVFVAPVLDKGRNSGLT
ncbi:uncharacterized protein LOC126320594 isoform X2 [Schistocerca gregaria]|uniref:uncharacterized protein LOC126320594 isoform X2 n=1 Tax=Schistocerca gregaria TaxID=7010 RepID=UPI00211DD87C|nr:uncharacterized protein LOC126320594 isoform X2 [Schistocerca gregaria]